MTAIHTEPGLAEALVECVAALRRVGALPDKVVTVAAGAEGVLIGSGGETAEIDVELAAHLFVHRL